MEGPQTRALADHLNELLTGRPVEQILVPEHRWQANVLLLNCVGQVIQRVRSHGKWIFLDFSHGVTWVCQLITRAKWHVQVPNQSPYEAFTKKPRHPPLLTVHLRGSSDSTPVIATLTGRPIFYILPTESVRQHAEIRALGPDPLSTTTFYDEFPYRLRQHHTRTVAAVLLDQEVIAGLGNMLKCEILYTMRFSPSVRVGALFASQIEHLAGTIVGMSATAATFAVKNEPFPYRVYDRSGLPCPVCNSEIVADHSGHDGRLTWYCPTCQPVGKEPTLFSP